MTAIEGNSRRLSDLTNPTLDRMKVVDALSVAAGVVSSLLADIIDRNYYLVGTGYDFSQFAEIVVKNLPIAPEGIACLWTERCEGRVGDSVFALPHEFVEPISSAGPDLIICSGVVADKMEILTHLIRIGPSVRPKRVVIASALINTEVKHELDEFLGHYFQSSLVFISDNETRENIENVRDRVATTLDFRKQKVMPIISEWLFSRRFGPRPHLIQP